MFLMFAQQYQRAGDLHTVQQLPAAQLSRWLDEVWYNDSAAQVGRSGPPGGSFLDRLDDIRRALGHPQPAAGGRPIEPSGIDIPQVGPPAPYTDRSSPIAFARIGNLLWHHLIYSYLIEATGAFDIVAEVCRRLLAGESLGTLTVPSLVWLRNTEELFFRAPPLFSVSGAVSDLRPSASGNRRNAYWRMFGMDLPHQIPAGWPGSRAADEWKQHTAPGVNTEFQEKLTELLRQVWLGSVNAQNTTGPNTSDAGYVALLCQAIRDMLHSRRQNGVLAREEFVYVSVMSWFHLTLLDGGGADQNAPIIRDLQAQGASPEQRLANLAGKVGMRSAPRSRELFQLSGPMSVLLRAIELGQYDAEPDARLLFTDPNVRVVINNWQSATGQRIKDADAVSRTSPMQPFRAPAPAGVTVTNGRGRQA